MSNHTFETSEPPKVVVAILLFVHLSNLSFRFWGVSMVCFLHRWSFDKILSKITLFLFLLRYLFSSSCSKLAYAIVYDVLNYLNVLTFERRFYVGCLFSIKPNWRIVDCSWWLFYMRLPAITIAKSVFTKYIKCRQLERAQKL